MGIALSNAQKLAIRKDASLLEAAGTHLDELLESLQEQIDNCIQTGNGQRSDLIQEDLQRYPIGLMAACRNDDGTVLDATGGAGKFSVSAGGWGTGTLILEGEDAQNATKTDTLCFEFALPVEYVADADVKVNVHARYDDSGGGTNPTCTIDVEAYELTDAGAVGADLCTTAAQSLTTSFGGMTFVLTDTDLTAGDRLLVLVRASVQEGGDTGTLTAQIGSIEMQLDVQG